MQKQTLKWPRSALNLCCKPPADFFGAYDSLDIAVGPAGHLGNRSL